MRKKKEPKLITDVVVKHSSAFNSERATGMNKLQQLQFVEALKKIIIGMLLPGCLVLGINYGE